jgi:hypothetical protein
VGLTAAEVGLKLYHRVPSGSGEALHRPHQHPREALGKIGAPEKFHRIPILIGSLTEMDLPEIGREFGLLIAAAGHILMRGDNFALGLEISRCRALDGGTGAFALLTAHLFVEAEPKKFHLHLLDLIGPV